MNGIQLTVDRFEGDGKNIAVLLTEKGESVEFLRSLLPRGTHAGDVLRFLIEKDVETTRAVSDETRRIQEKQSKHDDGGDITL